jgi:hypothetical protein
MKNEFLDLLAWYMYVKICSFPRWSEAPGLIFLGAGDVVQSWTDPWIHGCQVHLNHVKVNRTGRILVTLQL